MSEYETFGNIEIQLPDYMSMVDIPEEQVKLIGPILACGIKSINLIILTVDGKMFELDMNKFFSTSDINQIAYPIEDGQKVEFHRKDIIIKVSSNEILNSSKEIQLSNFEIDMRHKNKNVDITNDD